MGADPLTAGEISAACKTALDGDEAGAGDEGSTSPLQPFYFHPRLCPWKKKGDAERHGINEGPWNKRILVSSWQLLDS